jgi:hypothetical protein
VSLIEEALRRQQEQERQRTPPAAPAAAASTPPPPLPPLPAMPEPTLTVADPSRSKKSAQPMLALAGVLALVGLAAGLLWWFLAQSLPALSARTGTVRAEAPIQTTNQTDRAHLPSVASTGTSTAPHVAIASPSPAAPVVPGTATNTAATTNIAAVVAPLNPPPAAEATSVVAVVSTPTPRPRPAPIPAEPWPKFTLKGRVAFGSSYALMLGSGQILEVGDSTANGIQLVSATQDRVRLVYKGQTRDYRLQAGTFVMLPSSDPEPAAAE